MAFQRILLTDGFEIRLTVVCMCSSIHTDGRFFWAH